LRGDVADVVVADAGVIWALRRGIPAGRETERAAVLIEEIFLLETKPRVGIVENGRALVGGMRRLAVGHHDFAHYQRAIATRGIGIDRDRLQHTIGIVSFGLHGRGAVEAPQRQLFQCRERGEFLELCFAAQVRCRRVSVEPNLLEVVLRH